MTTNQTTIPGHPNLRRGRGGNRSVLDAERARTQLMQAERDTARGDLAACQRNLVTLVGAVRRYEAAKPAEAPEALAWLCHVVDCVDPVAS